MPFATRQNSLTCRRQWRGWSLAEVCAFKLSCLLLQALAWVEVPFCPLGGLPGDITHSVKAMATLPLWRPQPDDPHLQAGCGNYRCLIRPTVLVAAGKQYAVHFEARTGSPVSVRNFHHTLSLDHRGKERVL